MHLPQECALLAGGIFERLSDQAGRPISEREILKGLLLFGEKADAKKLLLSVKDAVFEGN
jgi:hypothetical protein